LDFIGMFDFEIEFFGGTEPEMTACDYLSRSTKIEQIQSLSNLDHSNIWTFSGITLSELMQAQERDDEVTNFKNGYAILKSKSFECKTINGVSMAKRRGAKNFSLIIPRDLISSTLEWTHGYNHKGITAMMRTISKQFFIPNATKRVKAFIRSCDVCLKKPMRKPEDLPIKQTSAKHPWSNVHLDLMGPMKESQSGNKYILAMICSLTRWTELRCIPTKHAQCVADALFDIFCSRGPPLSILCDNGKEFNNEALKIMLRNLGVHIQYTTPRRPQTNGLVERVNQKVKQQLQNWKATDTTWEDYIPPIQLSINLEHNRMLNSSPFYSIHGWLLQRMEFLDPEKLENAHIDDYDGKQWAKYHSVRMSKFLETIYKRDVQQKLDRFERLKKKTGGDSNSNNEKRKTLIRTGPVRPGSKVLIEFPQPKGETGKLFNPWKGLFIVVKRVDVNSYLVGPVEGTRRKFLVARKRMRVVEGGQKESMESPSEDPVKFDEEISKSTQCEKSIAAPDAVDDAENVVKVTSRGRKKDSRSSAPDTHKKMAESKHAMVTRRRAKTGLSNHMDTRPVMK